MQTLQIIITNLQIKKGYAASGGGPAGGGSTSEQWGDGAGTW